MFALPLSAPPAPRRPSAFDIGPASRALVGVFSPLEKSAEFFGFWGLANKLAGVLGIVMLGVLQTLIGLQASILLCVGLFIAAMLICVGVNERRGREAAVAWKSS